jgi:hypothetical protein
VGKLKLVEREVGVESPGCESRCLRRCPHHSPVRGLDTRLDLPVADHQTTLIIPRYQHDPLVQPRVELSPGQHVSLKGSHHAAPASRRCTALVDITHLVETREHVR